MDTVVVRSCPGIKRCMMGDPVKGTGVPVLQTEGVNVREMWKVCGLAGQGSMYVLVRGMWKVCELAGQRSTYGLVRC